MISGAAFCPHPPLLVPQVAGGARSETEPLRAACIAALTRVAAPERPLVVVGSGASSARFDPLSHGSFAPFGIAVEVGGSGHTQRPPLSLTVGLWLASTLEPAPSVVGFAVGPDFAETALATELAALADARDVTLLVMGDGSARRAVKAPGYLDERAARFDATVQDALAAGDAAALSALDVRLGEELLAAGTRAWRAAGTVLTGHRYDAELLFTDDTYGVAYFVAAWTLRE